MTKIAIYNLPVHPQTLSQHSRSRPKIKISLIQAHKMNKMSFEHDQIRFLFFILWFLSYFGHYFGYFDGFKSIFFNLEVLGFCLVILLG